MMFPSCEDAAESARAKRRAEVAQWKARNPERSKEIGRASYARCKDRDPEGHKQRRSEAEARSRARDPEKYKKCARERTARYRERFPEKAKEAVEARSVAQKDRYRCNRLRKRFGITAQQWDEMFESQGRVCGCCGADQPKSKTGWQTDHCHFSGKVRSILCHPCNVILTEHFQLNAPKFIDYLARHKGLSH